MTSSPSRPVGTGMNDGAVLLRLHSSAAQRECRRKLNIFIPHPAGGRSPSSHGFWGVIIYSDIGPLAAGGDHRPPFFLVGNNNLLIRKLLIPFFRPNHPFDVSQTGSNFIIIPCDHNSNKFEHICGHFWGFPTEISAFCLF